MEKAGYLAINSFEKLNEVNYKKYLDTKSESTEFDESGNLYDLFRMTIYRQHNNYDKNNKYK